MEMNQYGRKPDWVDENGDVKFGEDNPDFVNADNSDSDEDTLGGVAEMITYESEPYFSPEATVAFIRDESDFSRRNELLDASARHRSKANQQIGAGKSIASGAYIPHYRDDYHAYELSANNIRTSHLMGEMACAACPLADFCDIGPSALPVRLQKTSDRARFQKRVENPDNDHFCETNLTQSRLNKSIA